MSVTPAAVGGEDGADAADPQSASSYPHVISCNVSSCLDATQTPASGGGRSHVPGAAWNGGGAARFWMGTSGQSYAGFRQITLSGSQTQINIRFVYVIKAAFMADDEGVGPKHLILIRSTANDGDRMIAQQHQFAAGEWDLGLGNSVSPTYPSPRLWDYGEHVDEPICFEIESVVGGNLRYWITKQTGATWNETLTHTEACNNANGSWSQVDILGAFGGPQTEGFSNANAYFQFSHIKIHTSYIGPPAGFRS